MKKQEIIDSGLVLGLEIYQIDQCLESVLGVDKKTLFLLEEIPVSKVYEIQKLFYEISQGKPKEYVFKKANFYGRNFFVDSRVLIPRDETEILVEKMLVFINQYGNTKESIYVDVGTGSGCIALTTLLELEPLKFFRSFAVDISEDALDVAVFNAKNFGFLQDNISFKKGYLLSELSGEDFPKGKHMIISANLPYISKNDEKNLEKNVRKFEPHTALFGGENTGFELYEELIKQAFSLRQIFSFSSVNLFLEIGFDQHEVSKTFLEDLGVSFEYFEDLSKIKRVLHITF